MTTKTTKIEIIKPINSDWKMLGQVLRDIQYQTWKSANKAMQMYWDYSNFKYGYKERFGEYITKFEKLKSPQKSGKGYYKNIESDILNQLAPEMNKMTSAGKNATIRMVKSRWETDYVDIINGRKSIASYRRSIPIELHANQMIEENKKELMLKKVPKEELKSKYDQYKMSFQLIIKSYATELGLKNGWFDVVLGVRDDYQKAIVDRVISGEYKLSMSKLTYCKRKKKWYFNMAYTFTPEKKELNKDKIMGVDLGVNIPAMITVNDDNYYRKAVGNKQEIENFQKQINARKRSIQQQRKWCGDGSKGRGVKTRIKPLEKLSGKIARFKADKNHNWSRYIVNQAIDNECGVIQMEDLTGISDDNQFLKTWTYYDLQQKIKYKAEEVGIKIVMVDPSYTSSRCNKCGFIHSRDTKETWRPTQGQFKCMGCDYGHKFFVNADFNASKNIAMKDIEKIIKEQLKTQEKEFKNAMVYSED